MNSQEALAIITQKLESFYHNTIQSEQYARWMIETITGHTIAQLASHPITITPQLQSKIDYWLTQLLEHEEPIQYLIGTVPFGTIELFVQHPVLIPRPETEEWVMKLASEIKSLIGLDRPFRVLDACTGSGCIALALASIFPKAHVTAIDNAEHAIALAEKNKAHLKISNVTFLQQDITTFNPKKQFDLIVANPPYIDYQDWLELSPSVTAWEDYHALVADDNGYALIETVITKASDWLKADSVFAQSHVANLVIEIGHSQGEHTLELAQKNTDFKNAKINQDYAGKDRVLCVFK